MLYVGLDLSMRATGLVVLNEDGSLRTSGRIGWSSKECPCRTVHERIRYYVKVAQEVRAWVSGYDSEGVAIAVEDYATHGPGDPTLGPELGGIVRLGLVRFERLHEVSTTSLKKFATGKGNATKDVIMLDVFKRWGFDCNGDNNLADAYVLARMVRANYHGDETLTAHQRESLNKAGLAGLGERT